jgi:hypothetical protein
MNKYFSFPILVLLFFSTQQMHASVEPVFVESISINDGIWDVLSRVGIVVDEILGVSGCEYFIHQSDIPLTITASGNYCLVQSVTFTGTAVTINSSNVVFDMRNYTMNGNNSSNSVAINILADTNVIIQNGIIQGAASAGISSSQFLNDVIISNVTMIGVGGASGPSIGFSGGIEGLLIENCFMSNSGAINILGSGVTIRNCSMDNFLAGVGSGGIDLIGISPAHESRYSVIEYCNLTGSFAIDGAGIFIERTQNVIVQNCNITGPMSNAIFLGGVTNVRCLNCYVQGTPLGEDGIAISDLSGIGVASIVVDSCHVSAGGAGLSILSNSQPVMNVSVTNCFFANSSTGAQAATISGGAIVENVVFRSCIFSSNTGSGFELSTSGGLITSVAVEDCVAQGNILDGFQLTNNFGLGTTQNVVFKDCIAQNNSTDGFATAAVGSFSNIIYEHCLSQSNGADGFDFGATTTIVKVRDCVSHNNGNIGYNNLAAVGANIFVANSSYNDKTTGFVGVDYALTKTGATNASNATYWNNVVF